MDKKNTTIGLLLLVVAGYMMFQQGMNAPSKPQAPAHAAPGAIAAQPGSAVPTGGDPLSGPVQLEQNGSHAAERIVTLENPLAAFHFTNYGGAIQEVVLKDFQDTKDSADPYIMNGLRAGPALELANYAGASKDTAYQVLDEGRSDSVAFRTVLNGLEITRRYTISQSVKRSAPYLVRHELTFRNTTDQALSTGDFGLNIGTASPTGTQDSYLLTFGHYDGEDADFIEQSKFMGGGFWLFKSDPKPFVTEDRKIVWASLKNQFFTSILTPKDNGIGYFAQPVQFPPKPGETAPSLGITGNVKMAPAILNPAATQTYSFDYYIGPKEHGRISELASNEELAMQFGFFSFISKSCLGLMNWFHGMVGNYGAAIVLLVLLIRTVLLPINLVSSRSMKRMSKMSEPMKLMKEKFPDNPAKQQQMMMELYKLNKINPIAGCLPLVMQIPVFFGLFYMLRGAAELRFEEFLWIKDLSMPDTVGHVAGIPINIMPAFYLISMVFQMRLTPTPTVDNAQAKMMKFMPFIFTPFIYSFASALTLYWTISNIFTIGQQLMIYRSKDDFEIQLPPAMKKAIEGKSKPKGRKG